MVQDGQKMVKGCQEMVQDGQEMVQDGHFAHVQPERQRREGQQNKKETLDHPPHFYCSIFFLCSFLFSLFKSFHVAR